MKIQTYKVLSLRRVIGEVSSLRDALGYESGTFYTDVIIKCCSVKELLIRFNGNILKITKLHDDSFASHEITEYSELEGTVWEENYDRRNLDKI